MACASPREMRARNPQRTTVALGDGMMPLGVGAGRSTGDRQHSPLAVRPRNAPEPGTTTLGRKRQREGARQSQPPVRLNV